MSQTFQRAARVFNPKGRLVHRATGYSFSHPTLCHRVPSWHEFLDAETNDPGARQPCRECEARR